MNIVEATLPKGLFGEKADKKTIAQAVRVYLSNQRTALAKTKTRGEVNKTTAKMYKQKGTGKARHGAYSAPIFVGGGVAFGPTGEQNYDLKMSDKIRRIALLGALFEKAKAKQVKILSADKATGKTSEAAKLVSGKRTLLIISAKQEKVARAFRNIKNVTITTGANLNTYTVMVSRELIFTEEALKEAAKTYAK